MSKRYGIFFMFAAVMLLSANAFAQFRANGLGGGAGAGVSYGQTDIDRSTDPGLHFRAFLRHSLGEKFEVEVGAGIATKISGEDDAYKTDLKPIDMRLLFRPFATRSFSPHLYAGMGALHYDVNTIPSNRSANVDTESWTGFVPVGAALQFRIDDNTSFEINGGYNFVLSDEIDAIVADGNDGYFNAHAGLTMTGFDWNADPDLDGLTNGEERELGTDGQVADTDGDGLNDGDEFKKYKTDPLKADTDGDGLSDYAEVITHKSSPTSTDTDGDGLADMDEVKTHQTDPTMADSDSDGLTDAEEVNTYKSNPMNKDTDGDGLTDGDEVKKYKTKFDVADTDGDGLSDGDEVNMHSSNPTVADTDGGSVNDGVEVNRGTNPNKAEDDVVLEVAEVGAKIVLDGIIFATGKADISDQSADILEKAYQTMVAYPDMEVEIHGYTDATGSRSGNMRLSTRRAIAVRSYLVQKGIEGVRLTAKGFGPDNPIASNETAEGREKNRRIEFVRVK